MNPQKFASVIRILAGDFLRLKGRSFPTTSEKMMTTVHTTGEQTRSSARKVAQAEIHRALRNAVKVLKIKDNIAATASTMLCYIPADANDPISPVHVQRLADERNCTARTIHNHIRFLVKEGLAIDLTKDGGGRSITRDATGKIVSMHGISFQPLLDQAAKFERKVAEINAIATEKAIMRGQISTIRRKIKVYLEHNDELGQFDRILDDSPRRIAHLDMVQMNTLLNDLTDLFDIIQTELEPFDQAVETSQMKKKSSDQSEKNLSRYNNTTEINSGLSNRKTIETANELFKGRGKISPNDLRSRCGLDNINLGHAMSAAPEDWHQMIEHYGKADWQGFSNYAYQRGAELGMNASAWQLAENSIGRSGAALLVMIADVNSTQRGGDIKQPAAWVRAMADKASRGEAYLHKSIFGILNKETTLQ